MAQINKTTLQIRPGKVLKEVRVRYCGAAPVPGAQVAEIERDAYDRGQKDYHQTSQEQIFEAREDMRKIRDEVLGEIGQRIDDLCQQFARQAPELVMAIVRKVWAGLDLKTEQVMAIMNETLSELAPQVGDVEVSLSAQDYELLEQGETFEGDFPGLKLSIDKSLTSGDVLVRSRYGVLDGRIEQKLARMQQQLQEEH